MMVCNKPMKCRIILKLAVFVFAGAIINVAGCQTIDAPGPTKVTNRCDELDAHGLGQIRIGMTFPELAEAQKQTTEVFASIWYLPLRHHITTRVADHCVEVVSASPTKAILMQRAYDSGARDHATSRGIGVVATLADALGVIERLQDMLPQKRSRLLRLTEWFSPNVEVSTLPQNPRAVRPIPPFEDPRR